MGKVRIQRELPGSKRFFMGLGTGFIPLVVFTALLFGFGSNLETKPGLLLVPLIWLVFLGSCFVALVLAIINLLLPERRVRGYGLLTALLLSPGLAVLAYYMFTSIRT